MAANPEKQISLVINSITNDLLVTAKISVLDEKKQAHPCRSLIDSCSTSNFITENLANVLKLPRKQCSVPISGLNDATTSSMSIVTATIQSRVSAYKRILNFFVVPSIARCVPNQPLNRSQFNIPKNITLADPELHIPAPVEMLLGSGTTLSILSVGQFDLSGENCPDLIVQKTQLGWVIGGSPPPPLQSSTRAQKCFVTSDVNFEISKFWEIEEGEPIEYHTVEEEECERHFMQNITQASDGRYIVALPFNSKKEKLGESKALAHRRFISMERKLKLNPELQEQYNSVLQEYIDLGHMSPVSETDNVYLPHHAVLKDSLTTAVRVVFDGSAKSSTGISLNDTLMVGPTIQSDLLTLLLRFRKYRFVLTGDIEKMYRQFLIRPEDRKFQKILWKDERGCETTYELNTITFGLASAPYLAIRCLHQLAESQAEEYPRASRILQKDLYVDDALTGADTIEELTKIRIELTNVLSREKLKMRQWASNEPAVLQGVPVDNINRHVLLDDSHSLKTLGVRWNADTDTITYSVKPLGTPTHVTKRTSLSETAKIFDPLGLLAPVITTAKILMQKLWILKVQWDESLPHSLHSDWLNYHQQLQVLNNFTFDRKILIDNPTSIEMHGFCEASERAYGACIYIRSSNSKGETRTVLVCSKARVAPVKSLTIPRLELCGALLLSKLINTVQKSLKIEFDRTFCWTDSTIVLHWLQKPPQQLKTFASNRVAEIQVLTKEYHWRHVRTKDNPADLVSRGQLPEDFIQPSIWQQI